MLTDKKDHWTLSAGPRTMLSMTSTALTLRPAHASDGDALERLAALDSARVPAGPHLVAERDGELIAAISESHAVAIADPFEPTGDAVALLHRWAAERATSTPRSVRRSFAPRVGLGSV